MWTTDLVTHHVEQWAGFGEVIQSLLQLSEGLPLLQRLGQLADPAGGRREGEKEGRREGEKERREKGREEDTDGWRQRGGRGADEGNV